MDLIRQHELPELLGLHRSTIYRLRQRGDFPPAIRLGSRAIAFRREAVEEWLEEREGQAEPEVSRAK